jgi:hypothetical protein
MSTSSWKNKQLVSAQLFGNPPVCDPVDARVVYCVTESVSSSCGEVKTTIKSSHCTRYKLMLRLPRIASHAFVMIRSMKGLRS